MPDETDRQPKEQPQAQAKAQPQSQTEPTPDPLRHKTPRHLRAVGVIALCVAAAVAALGIISRVNAEKTVKAYTDALAIPTVQVITVSGLKGPQKVELPADVQALYSAPIYAQVSGYLRIWYTDIGARVKAGQTLAVIDTPNLDQQLAQSKAALAVAMANEHLSQITAVRWAGLLKEDAVSQQSADNANGDLAAKSAYTASQRANVAGLQAMEGFKRLVAPFDGIVTTRATDVGDLISIGTPGSTPLFTVADEHRLRVYVRVPQSYSALIKPGLTATFTVPEYPGRTFTAALATSADAITPQTGTLLVQLQIDNADYALKPGAYAQVDFNLPPQSGAISVPATALIFRDNGMSVAVIGSNGRVAMRRIVIAKDLGTSVDVSSGLVAGDKIINNPPDSLEPGDQVKVQAAAPPAGSTAHAKS